MHQDYINHKIVIYYTRQESQFLGWAKSFWLMKTPHPVVYCEVPDHVSIASCNDPHEWIKTFCPEHKNTKGIFVPVYTRILVELDFYEDSHQSNRFSRLKNGLPIICCMNTQEPCYENVEISDVFEDLSTQEDRAQIIEEIRLIREKLLINI